MIKKYFALVAICLLTPASMSAAAAEPAAALQMQWRFGAVQPAGAQLQLGILAQPDRRFGALKQVSLGFTGLRWQRLQGFSPVVMGVQPQTARALHADGERKRARWPWITAVAVVGGVALASVVGSDDDDNSNTSNVDSQSSDGACNVASTNGDGDVTVVSQECVP